MADHPWLVDITSGGGHEQVLYAVPHAGAGAAAVKQTCRLLADHCDTVAVRLPGRERLTAQEPWTDLGRLAGELARQVLLHAQGRRILLHGHCSGAVIAYETACRLPAAVLDALIVSANEAPDRIPLGGAWKLPRDAFLAQVAADGYLSADLLADRELTALVEPALRADYRLIEEHPPSGQVLPVPVHALVGVDERTVRTEDIAAWEHFTSAGFRLVTVPGGHNLLREEPAALAEAIRAATPRDRAVSGSL
ncbi:alpha/beta fold hydrolase [Streptomyces sp. NPDC046870]|uniref:thioesterase II family protein n=1 Tax=Streptomyces sp. NPDC046870 TaxID=3155135 RepID=UPI0034537140